MVLARLQMYDFACASPSWLKFGMRFWFSPFGRRAESILRAQRVRGKSVGHVDTALNMLDARRVWRCQNMFL